MTREETEVLDIIKFEFAKMNIKIIREDGYDFQYRLNGLIGQVHTKELISRYLMLKTNSHKDQLLKSVFDAFLGNGGLGGVVKK